MTKMAALTLPLRMGTSIKMASVPLLLKIETMKNKVPTFVAISNLDMLWNMLGLP